MLKVKEENSNSEASGEGRGALPAEAGAGQPRLLSFTPRLSKILKKKNNINIKKHISLPKVGARNRVPSRQLYYSVTEPLMRYPLEKLSGCCFF